jgi:hypothetical protein
MLQFSFKGNRIHGCKFDTVVLMEIDEIHPFFISGVCLSSYSNSCQCVYSHGWPFLLVFARGGVRYTAMGTAVSLPCGQRGGPFLAEIATAAAARQAWMGLTISPWGGLMLIWPVYTAFLIALLLPLETTSLFRVRLTWATSAL